MMNDPHDDRAILDSKYSLVIAVAKRAREIVNRREQPASPGRKPVTTALEEIERGKIVVTVKRQAAASEEPQDTFDDEPTEDPEETQDPKLQS